MPPAPYPACTCEQRSDRPTGSTRAAMGARRSAQGRHGHQHAHRDDLRPASALAPRAHSRDVQPPSGYWHEMMNRWLPNGMEPDDQPMRRRFSAGR